MKEDRTIGQKIRMLRKNKKLTQSQLANMIGISTISIRKYEAGDREPSNTTIRVIAAALDVDASDLLGLKPTSGNSPLSIIPPDLADKLNKGLTKLDKRNKLIEELMLLDGYELIKDDNLDFFIKVSPNGDIHKIDDKKLDEIIRDTAQFLRFKIEQLIKEGE